MVEVGLSTYFLEEKGLGNSRLVDICNVVSGDIIVIEFTLHALRVFRL